VSDWRPGPLPYRRALDLLITDLWPGGEVVSTSRMRGGIGTLMHAVDVVRRDERLRLVLRRFNRPQAGMDAELARREWDVLSRLHAIGLPVPQPLWVDTESEWFGVPALLLRRLRGRPDLDPQDLDAWARGIAGALAEIHAVEIGPFIDVLPDETREDRQLRYLASELSDDVVAAAPVASSRHV
jgi:aminoglycoside phosphotransferase (APT) family kinase protein